MNTERPSTPPEEGDSYYVCPECGEKVDIGDCETEPQDCIDHLPVEVLPEMFDAPGSEWVTRTDYDRCQRALYRAVKTLKVAREQLKDERKKRDRPGITPK